MVGMGFKKIYTLLILLVLLSLSLSACNIVDGFLGTYSPPREIDLPKALIEKPGFKLNLFDLKPLYWSSDNTAFFWQGFLVDPKTNSEDLSPLYMTNIQTKQTREIDINGKFVFNLHLSSDGKTLYFTESLDTESPSIFGTCLYEYNLATDKLDSHLCDVLGQNNSETSSIVIAFSPDNTQMVYQTNGSIFLYNLSNKESRLLLESSSASLPYFSKYYFGSKFQNQLFSPDGSQLLILVDSKPAIFTLDSGNSEPLDLSSVTENSFAELRWAQEGILGFTYSSPASNPLTLYNLSTGSKETLQISNNSADLAIIIEAPYLWSWSKANDKIVYETTKCLAKNGYTGLCINQHYLNVYNRQSREQTVLAKNDTSFLHSLSNDGKKIIFSHRIDNSENIKTSFYLLDIP